MNSESELLRSWEMTGGISATVTGIEVLRSNGEVQKLVVRQHGEVDLQGNPLAAVAEYKLLQLLKTARVPVPTPYDYDQTGDILSSPYVVIEFIEGETVFSPSNIHLYIEQLAAMLVKLHRVDLTSWDLSYLPKQDKVLLTLIRKAEANYENLKSELKTFLSIKSNTNKNVILHGDFWPGNTLWKDEKLVAVIDWEDAAIGDPLFDVANARLELLWAFDDEAMKKFTTLYQFFMPTVDFTNLPYWDLFAALRHARFPEWGLEKSIESAMREKHQWFIDQAFNTIQG